MPTTSRFAAAGALAVVSACAHPQRPVEFQSAQAQRQTAAVVSTVLQSEGLRTAVADADAGVIVTAWGDSGYRHHVPEPAADWLREEFLFRRYKIDVRGQGAGARVHVEMEVLSCDPDVQPEPGQIRGRCASYDETVPPGLQRDMDELGHKLQHAVALHGPG